MYITHYVCTFHLKIAKSKVFTHPTVIIFGYNAERAALSLATPVRL